MIDAVIIGAGISGLCAAYHLKKSGQNILLLESSDRVGGVIQSLNAEEFLLERGPNSLRGSHEFLDLVDELHLTSELITGDPKAPAYVYFDQRLQPVPMSPTALITTKLLSTQAKFRLLKEPFIRARTDESEESLASFVRRRLGDEILVRLVAPFVSGVYAGDPEQLSVQAAFARLADLEANSGSIFAGAMKAAKAARANKIKPVRSLRPYRLCSFKNGMETLPTAIAKYLGENLLTASHVRQISKTAAAQFEITFEQHGNQHHITTESLIIATPSDAAAQLLQKTAPDISSLLTEIPYTKLVTVPLAYRTEQLAHALKGFGFLAPRDQGLRTLGSIWNSSLFTNRAPDGWVLLNNFIGGETDLDAINLSDEDLIRIVHQDLQKVLGISGAPKRLPITRWHRAIPQYRLGHAARVAKIEAALSTQKGLRLAGNYLHGVALGDCIKHGKEIAESIARSDT